MNERIFAGIAAWCILHLVFLLIRLPFSEEKLGRIKLYGIGVLFVIALVAMGYGVYLVDSLNYVQRLDAFLPRLPLVAQMLTVLTFGTGAIVALFAATSLLFGHAATMWFSWMVSDFEVWSQNH